MRKTLDSWRLFWALALTTSIAISLGLPGTDFHSARGLEPIILRAVRCALPWFVVAFSASSLATLWPSRFTRWLRSNRRYFGLAFAFGMGWHLSFVGYSILLFGNRLNAKATSLDLIGLVFLLLLTVTSFQYVARRLSASDWRRLHKAGVYVIWFLATEIYLGIVRGGADLIHRLFLGLLVLAWLLRVAAWLKRRLPHRAPASSELGSARRGAAPPQGATRPSSTL
jgi:methionine sulfoxide reductase heme-binding subunit